MAIDKEALARFRVVAKPLTAFTPEGIFPGYPQPKGDAFNVTRARELLAEGQGFGTAPDITIRPSTAKELVP